MPKQYKLQAGLNILLEEQYLNHRDEFNDWMNRFIQPRPLQQVPGEEDSTEL